MGSRPSWDGVERRDPANEPWRKCYDELVARARARDKRNRGWTVGLALWLTAISLLGFLAVRDALDRIQAQRRASIVAQCHQHDGFITTYSRRIDETLRDPKRLAQAARERNETPAEAAQRLRDGKRLIITLIEQLAPRNPRHPNDHRPCQVIADDVAG